MVHFAVYISRTYQERRKYSKVGGGGGGQVRKGTLKNNSDDR